MTARILFVDDEPDIESLVRQRFRRQVKAGEIDCHFARDGVEALSMLAEMPDMDIVVSDLNMPRMDGLSLLAKLQEREERPSTVIVSAYGDMANIRIAMNRGAFDFLTKPIDFIDLQVTIEKTLRHVDDLRSTRFRLAAAEHAYASLSRYFSPNLVDRLVKGDRALDLDTRHRDVARLFTDITGFTTLVESQSPSILGSLLNDYLNGMADIVFAHEGTLMKILGDSLHLLFGAPGDQPDYATRAVACALDLAAFAETFRMKQAARGIALGRTRIGIDAGPALVGNFGGGRFFDYTAYGDPINTAARLETANKSLGTSICASSAVVEAIDGFHGRPIGDLLLRGRSEPVRAFEPLPVRPGEEDALDAYRRAFRLMEAGDEAAVSAFAALVGRFPSDALLTFQLKRLLNGGSGALIDLR